MKGIPVMVAALLVSGILAVAQVVCPPSFGQPYGGAFPTTGTIGTIPWSTGTMTPGFGMTAAAPGLLCPTTGLSRDNACLLSEIRALRGDVIAAALTMQGQTLTTRLNQLMAQEMVFRQAIAAEPNLPNAQLMALQFNMEAQALNRDMAAFTRQLSMIPVEQRPYLATSLNTFDVVYWQPTIQAFGEYRAQLPAAGVTYQPALAQNPWLQTWFTNYQTALTPLSQTPQVFASARWWNQPMVLGSTEMFPGTGSMMVMPNGSVIFIPAGTASIMGTGTMAAPATIPTDPMGAPIQ